MDHTRLPFGTEMKFWISKHWSGWHTVSGRKVAEMAPFEVYECEDGRFRVYRPEYECVVQTYLSLNDAIAYLSDIQVSGTRRSAEMRMVK